MERKFTRGLNKPGMAAQLRESVSQVVRESAVLVSCVLLLLPLQLPLPLILFVFALILVFLVLCDIGVFVVAAGCVPLHVVVLRVLCVGATVNVNVNEINNLFSTVIKFYSIHILHSYPPFLSLSVAMFHRNSLLYFHCFLGKHPKCLIRT